MTQPIIGIMGPGEGASSLDCSNAESIGAFCASRGYFVLTGGRPVGVMEAGLKGAKSKGGITIGILPSKTPEDKSIYVDIPIVTGIGGARNYINALSSDVIVACGVNEGTLTEIAFALANNHKVILLCQDKAAILFLEKLGGVNLTVASSPDEAVMQIEQYISISVDSVSSVVK